MKCVICNSPDIEKKTVQEEIHHKEDVVLIPIEVMVCLQCGERYYDRRTMKFLEETEAKIAAKQISLRSVGRVLKAVN